MGAARRAAPAWRPSCLALCLLPVALPLLLLWLPLLCVAVAVARFRRRRRRLAVAATGMERGSSCCVVRGERSSPQAEAEGEGHRAALLHKYLEDQMELVGAGGDAMYRPPSSQRSRMQQQ